MIYVTVFYSFDQLFLVLTRAFFQKYLVAEFFFLSSWASDFMVD